MKLHVALVSLLNFTLYVKASYIQYWGPYPPVDENENRVPIFELLSPKGLRIVVPGPYPSSLAYTLKAHIIVSDEESFPKNDLEREVTCRVYYTPGGQLCGITFSEVNLKRGYNVTYSLTLRTSALPISYAGTITYTGTPPTVEPRHESGIKEIVGVPSLCSLSVTTFNGGKRACAGQPFVSGLQFTDVIQIGGSQPEDNFTVFAARSEQEMNYNKFVMSVLEEQYGEDAVYRDMTIKDCTSTIVKPNYCNVKSTAWDIIPPVIGHRSVSRHHVSFRYGVLEVSAKLPQGDWIVPELWLMPMSDMYGKNSGRMVLAMSRGNLVLNDNSSGSAKDYSGRLLEAGVQVGQNHHTFEKLSSKHWSESFHSYKLVWKPDYIQFLVDGEEIGRYSENMAPFNKEFFLVFGIHAGVDKHFPDSLIGKPWGKRKAKAKVDFWEARHKWRPTWSEGYSALFIANISLTALDELQ